MLRWKTPELCFVGKKLRSKAVVRQVTVPDFACYQGQCVREFEKEVTLRNVDGQPQHIFFGVSDIREEEEWGTHLMDAD